MIKKLKLLALVSVVLFVLIVFVPASTTAKTYEMVDGSRFVCHPDGGMTIYCSNGQVIYMPGLGTDDWAEWRFADGTYHVCFPPNGR